MMQIYLLDRDKEMIEFWKKEFESKDIITDKASVQVIHDDFSNFMSLFKDTINGIVAPGNSFGYMDGGYDKAIIDYLGDRAQSNVLTAIDTISDGYLQVGRCIAVSYQKYTILYTPTMRFPEKIIDGRTIFDCMLSCLRYAEKIKLNSIVIPAFGGCTGGINKQIIAKYMKLAYDYFISNTFKNHTIDWNMVRNFKKDLENVQGYDISKLSSLSTLDEFKKQNESNHNHITYQLTTKEPSFFCSCGGIVCKDRSKILTSNPPKYEYTCSKCRDKYYFEF